jgi:hypothetical protein
MKTKKRQNAPESEFAISAEAFNLVAEGTSDGRRDRLELAKAEADRDEAEAAQLPLFAASRPEIKKKNENPPTH